MANMTRQEYVDMQKETVAKSQEIYKKALAFCPHLFSVEIYPKFLSFMAGWNHFSALNAVLIYMQYPTATYLSGFKKWQVLAAEQGYNSSHLIIKEEQRKRGISILIPFSFTNPEQKDERYLTYKSVLVFDVSQINEIQAPPCFSPYVKLNQLEFPVFLSLCRRQFRKDLSFAPGNPEESAFRFQSAFVRENTLFYLDSSTDPEKIQGILQEIIRYFVYQACKEEQDRELVFLSTAYVVFHYLQFDTAAFRFASIDYYRSFSPERLFRIIYYINHLSQYMIYEFHRAYGYFLTMYSDRESNRILEQYKNEGNGYSLATSYKSIYFDFNEINIIHQNLTSPDREEFMKKLYHLRKNTKDAMLLHSIKTLVEKLLDCSDKQFQILFEDKNEGSISTTDGYALPDM